MVLMKSFLVHKRPYFFYLFNGLIGFRAKILHSFILTSPYSSPAFLQLKKTVKEVPLPNSGLSADIYFRIVENCTQLKMLEEGKKIHQHILWSKAHVHLPSLLEKLTLMYLSCNKIEVAHLIFYEIPKPSIFLCNAMIRAYAWKGPFNRAIDLYYHLIGFGIKPNKYTFPFVLKACSTLLAVEEGTEIHNHAKKMGLDCDVYISTALIDMYMKCGKVHEARLVFLQIESRDVVAWNAMVAGCSLHGLYDDAVGILLEMQSRETSPNSSTMVGILPVIGQAKALLQGKGIHCFCLRRFFDEGDVLVNTAILDMYAKCESVAYARTIFNKVSLKNEVTWSAMIGGYVQCEKMVEALVIFDLLKLNEASNMAATSLASVLRACASLSDVKRGTKIHCYLIKSGFLSDITVGNSLLSMYAKVGSICDAVCFFNEMDLKDTVSYSAIISGLVQNGSAEEALAFFKRMQLSCLKPDVATMVGVLPACSYMSALRHGRCSHGYAITFGLSSEVSICNALIDMYAKCGKIDLSRLVFDGMKERGTVTWNVMIASYGIHGLGAEALSLFDSMQDEGFTPDDITFISLFSACSHSGLVIEGRSWYESMTQVYNIVPRMEHYICIVDLFARGGLLAEAHDFITRMPFEPDVRVWSALLSACRTHKNTELGNEVSGIIQRLGPEGSGNFVLMSNIYSAAGRHHEAARVRILQQEKGFRKSPGCSWVEIQGKIHAFIGGDSSHPQSSMINEKLADLFVEIRKLGYKADTSFVIHDLVEEEKENALVYHSEKLAIAFALVSLSGNQPIFITKNLRVCGDCHTAIKLITLVTKRAITVRDVSRFHHFEEGLCNCGDFW
ncbi:pentatricopeptide repeat-containing protein At3g16610 [Dendrobium catenatum]|uniref:Pentatricopeptide repeat-containing protein n=1 Tax=Dendrobium catenatum TaxID=906689 RepID=A0A2I0WD78_9ASPA|nr:pentatricopeptide repeat-containing protein At3g16610 [Dendrobium catenatum]XP_028553160.1 pentatricopeptide repeat-containing protein At3g16610 [Dendrobium catenatum]PKU73603.1 Pentatricopeptide repeat-containing protein [Dendrobium catenatum]